MITANEAAKIAEGLDISEHTAFLTVGIHAAARNGLRSITLHKAPYNSLASNHADPKMIKLLEELKASGFDVVHLPSHDQREPDSVRISW